MFFQTVVCLKPEHLGEVSSLLFAKKAHSLLTDKIVINYKQCTRRGWATIKTGIQKCVRISQRTQKV